MRARQSTATFLSCVNYCDDAYKPTVRIMTCLQHLHFLQRVLVFTMYYPSPQYHRNLKMEIDFSRKALKPLDRIQNVQCVSHHCHIFWTELATQLVNFCCSCSSSTCVSNLGFVLLMHLETYFDYSTHCSKTSFRWKSRFLKTFGQKLDLQ